MNTTYIGTIGCGCGCGVRVRLGWNRHEGLVASGPHGIEAHPDGPAFLSYSDAAEYVRRSYSTPGWDLRLGTAARAATLAL